LFLVTKQIYNEATYFMFAKPNLNLVAMIIKIKKAKLNKFLDKIMKNAWYHCAK